MKDDGIHGRAAGTAHSGPDSLNLSSIAGTLWRGKWLVLLTSVIGMLLAGYYAFVVAIPQYRATAVVILETQQESVVDLQSVVGGFSGDTSAINSEVEVLRARSLMGKVVDRLDLTKDPEFNGDLRPPTLRAQIRERVYGMLGRIEPENSLSADAEATRVRDAVVTRLLRQVTVRNVPSSLVFQVTVETENAEKSALIADTIVSSYILNQLEVKFEATEQATSWLSDRVATLQIELEDAEARVKDFSAGTDLVSVEGLQALERQIKDLRDRIASAKANEVTTAATVTQLNAATDRDAQAEAAADPQLDRLLVRARSDDAMASAFDTRFAQIVARAELEATRSAQQSDALEASLAPLEAQIERQGQDLIELQQLQREAEASRLLYEYFLGRLKETSAQEGIQQADSRILSDAVVPIEPSEPRKTLLTLLGAFVGLFVGALWVTFRESGKDDFRTAAELEQFTGEAVLGQIPVIPGRGRKRTLTYLAEKPTSAAAEAIRNLRTSVLLSNADQPPQIILSTSSLPAEGKTTNSLALTQNLAGMGKKVLLVEGDIRRRTFQAYFEDLPQQGLVSVLAGDMKLEDAILSVPLLGADVLGGEQTTTNAADLFSSDRFKALISDMRARYDHVIIDTPPVLVVPDARIIAQHVDSVLFTVKWDSTTKPQVDESLRLFRDANLRISGLVLSQINPRGMKRYGYGGKYGAYGAYGARYYTN